jgi:transcriptional regulator with XRE-family HTH domain
MLCQVDVDQLQNYYALPYALSATLGGMTPGQRIRAKRKEFGFRQGEFAELVGIAQSTLSDIERGETLLPEAPNLLKIAELLKVSQAWIITGEDGELRIPTKEEMELLNQFRELDESKRKALLALLASMSEKL